MGGGFILGVAEAVYTPKLGLLWALMPLQYSTSFIIGKTPQTVQQVHVLDRGSWTWISEPAAVPLWTGAEASRSVSERSWIGSVPSGPEHGSSVNLIGSLPTELGSFPGVGI